ncbi:MAG: iron-sulfur cluster assembly protein, partial [Alphaproteobacteria bacterium]
MFKFKRLNEDDILRALEGVVEPLSAVQGVQVDKHGAVVFMIEVDPAKAAEMEPVRARAEDAVRGVKGVKSVA